MRFFWKNPDLVVLNSFEVVLYIFSLFVKEDDVRDPRNPDSFPWCLMNLCITKIVQEGVRKILSTAGLEVLGE